MISQALKAWLWWAFQCHSIIYSHGLKFCWYLHVKSGLPLFLYGVIRTYFKFVDSIYILWIWFVMEQLNYNGSHQTLNYWQWGVYVQFYFPNSLIKHGVDLENMWHNGHMWWWRHVMSGAHLMEGTTYLSSQKTGLAYIKFIQCSFWHIHNDWWLSQVLLSSFLLPLNGVSNILNLLLWLEG